MEVIKLDRRFKAYHNGFTHAIKFTNWINGEARAVSSALYDIYGWDWDYTKPYKSFVGKKSKYTGLKPQYFAVKNESIITQVLLKMEMNK